MCSVTLALLTLFCAAAGYAGITKHLGVLGRTYPVIEPDLMEELRQSAIAVEKKWTPLLTHPHDYQPKDLHPLPRASTDKTFLVDMLFTLDHDISDGKGNIVYPKGFSFNPLNHIAFSGDLLVLDGSDPEQLAWWEQSPYFDATNLRLLLSGGKAGELGARYQRPFYYLTKVMAERLQLQAVPSLVLRKNNQLEVREVLIPKEAKG
jgi:conjugal transfer pilus assembly protein TraW